MSRPSPKPPPRKHRVSSPGTLADGEACSSNQRRSENRPSSSGIRPADYRPPAPTHIELEPEILVSCDMPSEHDGLRPLRDSELPTLTPDPHYRLTPAGFELVRRMVVEFELHGRHYVIECEPGLIVPEQLGAVPRGLRSAFAGEAMARQSDRYRPAEIQRVVQALWAVDMGAVPR